MLCYSRRRGQSFFTVLLVLALVLGGAIFIWQKFLRVRSLVTAGQHVLVMAEYSQGADLEYRRHWREHSRPLIQNCRNDMAKLLDQTLQGKFAGKSGDFNQKYEEHLGELLDGIEQFDMNMVPPLFLAAHRKLSTSFRPFYECLEALKDGYRSEGSEQKMRFEEARKKLLEASSMSKQGEDGIQALIQQ